jgi:hypothetical protein
VCVCAWMRAVMHACVRACGVMCVYSLSLLSLPLSLSPFPSLPPSVIFMLLCLCVRACTCVCVYSEHGRALVAWPGAETFQGVEPVHSPISLMRCDASNRVYTLVCTLLYLSPISLTSALSYLSYMRTLLHLSHISLSCAISCISLPYLFHVHSPISPISR